MQTCCLRLCSHQLVHESQLVRPQLKGQRGAAQHDAISLPKNVIHIAHANLVLYAGYEANILPVVTFHHEAPQVLGVLSCLYVGG